MAGNLGGIIQGCQRLGLLLHLKCPLGRPSTGASVRTTFVRTVVVGWLEKPVFSKPRDLSLPNSSWSSEMMQLYNHYNSQCEVETEGGERWEGQWRRLPSYDRVLKYSTGGVYLNETIQSKARLFTRSVKEPGAGFEYVLFANDDKQKCVCVFQAGHLLEGPPGYVHGGAIASMIDTVTGIHASLITGPVMTANLNINYCSPIPLGSTVLLESSLDKKEGRKIFISCKVTSTDGTEVHTHTTALFLSINVGHLQQGT